jgi:N-acetylgalactosamine-6-sulfatase
LDWIPNLCHIAGIRNYPQDLDGEDSTAAWLGRDYHRHKPLFWKTNSTGSSPSIRDGDWKLHRQRKGTKPELYDLSKDPSESNNVIDQFP